ncbi:DUF4870 domain-containing protein [uncultured Phycicoccus sp.]|uniref:DUF4870 domain-containing protein n=1 Tax=uncultured Phycicoccus sp. TaxID=661422 RepID=UPI002609DF19|nr:DUF4870 domain-containing protein [uncultured Phycicoccus sp.]
MSDTTPRDERPEGDAADTPAPPPPPAAAEPTAPQQPPAPSSPPPPPPPGDATGYTSPAQPYGGPPAPGQAYGGSVPTPMSPQDEKTWGMASHGGALAATVLSGGVLSFVVALVMYLVFRDRGPFVRAHAANALNVQIIVSIVFLVSLPLMFVLVGFLTFAAAWVFAVIVHIVGMLKAYGGEWWDPPLTPKFVS